MNDYTPEIPTKKCRSCWKLLPATPDYFAVNPANKDGLISWCHDCMTTVYRPRVISRPEKPKPTPEEIVQRKEKKKIRAKAYRSSPEFKAKRRLYKEKERAKPEFKVRRKLERQKRRQRVAVSGIQVTPTDVTLQIKAQTDKRGRLRCWWCGKPIIANYDLDHVIPLSRGGLHHPNNIVISHPKCNRHKHDKLPSEFAGRLF